MRISDWSSDVCSSDLKGCRRSGGYRTDKVELCTRHSHGGLHRSGAYQVDGMNEDNKQNEELNEDIAEASGPAQAEGADAQNGRAPCRERVGKDEKISVVAVALKEKNKTHIMN